MYDRPTDDNFCDKQADAVKTETILDYNPTQTHPTLPNLTQTNLTQLKSNLTQPNIT
jgi:hypothetical protein